MGLKFTKSLLTKKTKAELIELAETEGIDYDEDATKAELIEELLVIEEADDDVEDDEEVDDSEEEDDLELPEDDEEEVDEVEEVVVKKTTKKTKYTEGGKADDGEKLLGAKEVATQIGTDAKTLRQFFRSGKSTVTPVGAGGRYEFKESQITDIKAEFETWKANKPGRGAARSEGGSTRKRGAKPGPKAEDIIEEVEDIEELDDVEELDEDDLELED